MTRQVRSDFFCPFHPDKNWNVRRCSSCPSHFNPLLHVFKHWNHDLALLCCHLRPQAIHDDGERRFHALCFLTPKLNQSFRSQIDTLHCPIMISWLVTCSWGLKWLGQAFKSFRKLEQCLRYAIFSGRDFKIIEDLTFVAEGTWTS